MVCIFSPPLFVISENAHYTNFDLFNRNQLIELEERFNGTLWINSSWIGRKIR